MDIFKNLSYDELNVINLIKKECIKENVNVYLVGGIIRDSILDKRAKDIDMCIEANPIRIIKRLKCIEDYKYYEKFHTSTILFKNGVKIDLIRTRKEEYEYKGALPKITPSNIYDDLYRRDFTINAIAYDIIRKKFIDPFNGLKDIKNKTIKKIHSNSYYEDPTRIFRAIKYSNRYDFNIYDIEEIQECIKSKVFVTISSDRIIREILLLCNETNWIECLSSCDEFKIFNIDLERLKEKNTLCNYLDSNDRLINLFLSLNIEEHRKMFINNSILQKELKNSFKNYKKINLKLKDTLFNTVDNLTIYKQLSKSSIYELKLLSFNSVYRYKILNYLKNLKNITLNVKGDYLLSKGIKQGKNYSEIFEYLLRLKLNTYIIDERKYLDDKLGEILNVIKHKN